MIAEQQTASPRLRNAVEQVTIGTLTTSWGSFGAVVTDTGLARLTFPAEPFEHCESWIRRWAPDADRSADLATMTQIEAELNAYLHGDLQQFTLPLDLRGTAFQQQVWKALLDIPYGQTRSYRWAAEQIGRPTAVRAVGLANGANPVPIVVPCHRVVGSNGTLTGYGGGLDLKIQLLELEGITVGQGRLW